MPKTLNERKAGTTCARCRQPRWPFKDWASPTPVSDASTRPAIEAPTPPGRAARRSGWSPSTSGGADSLVNKGG